MADKTGIEWTDATWNPIVGCSIVSPGCTNCYAMAQAARIERMQPGSHYAGTTQRSKAGPVWTGKLALAPERILTAPLRWKRPRKIFVNSMGDLFHEDAPDQWIDRVFAVMALAPQHTFQVLTKRADRMRRYLGGPFEGDGVAARIADATWEFAPRNPGRSPTHFAEVAVGPRLSSGEPEFGWRRFLEMKSWPLPNVWLGVSAERQQEADERIPHLLATPAAIRFVSAEPLLGPIDFRMLHHDGITNIDALAGKHGLALTGDCANLNWVIVGGESGPNARPMHPAWARSIRDQCAAAGVAFHFKQWGAWLPGQNDEYPSDGRGRRLAHWQDGGWGPRDVPRGLLGRNYIMWEPDGTPRRGDQRIRQNFEVAAWAQRVGKHRAGRLLDGVEHNAFPILPRVAGEVAARRADGGGEGVDKREQS